ncbi:MAG TPA: YbjN domain-containing protein [Spirochaetia bacterium]|nr:YbjN domain-containing protein [Spirochaetales bacterium]HRY80539.1 YbjN domain-containing protein [Spirochaetia bacterium]HRZ88810.1 YbjN domain-containing protein [Spirochaetia bacterium]
MAGLSRVESYLISLEIQYEEISPNAWLVNDEARGLTQVVITQADPVVALRTKVMAAPKEHRQELFETLLRLNASDLLHGAYALEGDDIVLVDNLELETLDRSELEAALDAVGFALAQHYAVLGKFRA